MKLLTRKQPNNQFMINKDFTANTLFRDWIDSLPNSRGIKTMISEKCHVSYRTVQNWYLGIYAIDPIYQEKINQVFDLKIFNV